MRKFLQFCLAAVFLIAAPLGVLAQENTEDPESYPMDDTDTPTEEVTIGIEDEEDIEGYEGITAEDLFEIELAVGTQSVISGKIPLYLYVKPKIDSSKAQVQWEIPRGLNPLSATEEWFEMKEDKGKVFTIYVEPETAGHYEVLVSVTAWRYDTNYVGSSEVVFDIDANLKITPQTAEYQRNNILLIVGVVVLSVSGCVGAVFLVKFVMKRFKKWMAED